MLRFGFAFPPRVFLLVLVATGAALHFVAVSAAFRPTSWVTTSAIVLHIAYVFMVPVALWKMAEERSLRIFVLGVWVAYIAFLSVRTYQFLAD
jgi:hypothetical protein